MSGVLFTVIFGIIQYGLYFNDSLNTRQGVREAARQAIVQMPVANSCGAAGITWVKLECVTDDQVGALTGDPAVHFKIPDTLGWKKANRLIVCAAVASKGVFGILPMPSGGVTRSKTTMSIEQDSAPPSGNPPNTDSDPTGEGWAWCK